MDNHIISLSQSKIEDTLSGSTTRINKLSYPLNPLRPVLMLLFTKIDSSSILLIWLSRGLQKIASLEIRIRMNDRIQISLTP